MSESSAFFFTGWEHIVDINAYDHLLFVTTLCAAYRLAQWRQILVLITAFTLGHSVTLVLSSLELIPTNPTLVEVLIPISIMATAIANVAQPEKDGRTADTRLKYAIALGFGLVHGLAFASNFKVIMFGESILAPLFLFNIGIEAGQVFIVALFMFSLWLFSKLKNAEHYQWNLFVSGAGFGVAGTILLSTLNS